MATLKELSDLYAKKQPTQVDSLTEDAPILAMFPWEPASHNMWNVYASVASVTGPSFVDLNKALPTISMDSDIKQFDLAKMGGQMTVPFDTAQNWPGGAAGYFANQTPSILREGGASAEQSILYNTLRAYAIANGYALEPASPVGDSANYSLLAVRFVPGVTTGLYNPLGFAQGAMLESVPINGGAVYDIGSGIYGFGMMLVGYFGVQVADPRTVGTIVNIQPTKIPTAMQMDDIISMVRGTPANTYLFMHPRTQAMIQSLKDGYMQMTVNENGINRVVAAWNGIPIVTSYNFYNGTEPDVSI
jgi:hypothetical protein